MSPILCIDGYKLDHRRQYPDRTQRVYSNWTPRGSRIPGTDSVVFFGLQYFLREYLDTRWRQDFFDQPRGAVVAKYRRRVDQYLGPNPIGTEHIEALHALGYLPLTFRALPEGTLTPLRVPMFTVENTHDDFAWLPNYLETLLSCEVWMGCTSATSAYGLRRFLDQSAQSTGGDPTFVPWQGHDFSMRGMAGLAAAQISGAAHALSFFGSDTVPVFDFVERYYGGDEDDPICGSVPATEHSVMCAGGQADEEATFRRLLRLYPSGIISVVSDTWDLWDVLTRILPRIKAEILGRPGKLVIRPDSGDPVRIICGDPSAPEDSPARRGVIQLLWDVFGGTVNKAGYRELDPHIGAIYGDAISRERAVAIVSHLQEQGFASTNIVFGVGSFTYQYVTRDTHMFAMKATWAKIDGKGHDLFKKPVTDDGTKHSATGRLAVFSGDAGKLYAVDRATPEQEAASLLQPVWTDGKFERLQTFGQIRRILHPDWLAP